MEFVTDGSPLPKENPGYATDTAKRLLTFDEDAINRRRPFGALHRSQRCRSGESFTFISRSPTHVIARRRVCDDLEKNTVSPSQLSIFVLGRSKLFFRFFTRSDYDNNVHLLNYLQNIISRYTN